jgi:hypothetical protein
LEALLGNVLIISIAWIFSLNVVFFEQLGKTKSSGRKAVESVKRPENLLTGLNREGSKGEPFLALVQAQTVRQANGNTLVVLKPLVVGTHGTVEKGKSKALEGVHGVLHENGVEGGLPLLLAIGKLREIRVVG